MKRALVALLALASAVALAEDRIPAGARTLWPAADLRWEAMPGLPGAQQARLWGDPTRSAHGILYRWKAGTDVPPHTHSNGDRGVIVGGVLTLAVEGGPVQEFPPGSYFSLAGGVRHATACRPGADCVFFIQREGPFDAVMTR
jgi:quercetin dioxygenase-like cupin family protein